VRVRRGPPPGRLARMGGVRSVPRLAAAVICLAVVLAFTPLPMWVGILLIAAAGLLLPL
jgi:hypothetical protein